MGRKLYVFQYHSQIAASHVSPGLKCTSNIVKTEQPYQDMKGQQMTLECGVVGTREVRKIIDACGEAHEFIDEQSDQVAANGVVHVIKDPAIPTSCRFYNNLMAINFSSVNLKGLH